MLQVSIYLLVAIPLVLSTSWQFCPVNTKCKPLTRESKLQQDSEDSFQTFCYNGSHQLSVFDIWKSIKVAVPTDSGIQLYIGDSCRELFEAKNNNTMVNRLLTRLQSNWLQQDAVKLSPFGCSCLGLEIPKEYQEKDISELNFRVELKGIDIWFLFWLAIGLTLFFQAERLSKNIVFFYCSGISVGLLASLLIIVYIMSRFVPTRAGAYSLLFGGWSVVLYLLQWSWNNMKDLIFEDNQYILGYFILAGIASFALCYYYGPVTDPRGLNLIKWSIQLVAVLLLYKSTQSDEASLAIIVLVIFYSVLPRDRLWRSLINRIPYRLRMIFYRYEIRLLTQEEYVLQGKEETKKALEELKQFCDSPDCNSWKLVSRLKSPTRFADFMQRGAHVTSDEIINHELDPSPYYTSDEETDSNDVTVDLAPA